jgi:hypothetical protein
MAIDRSYPDGVDPRKVDDYHNARGETTPYSAHQRRQAAALIRRYKDEGMDDLEAKRKAFEAVGEPEHPLGEHNPDDMSDFGEDKAS